MRPPPPRRAALHARPRDTVHPRRAENPPIRPEGSGAHGRAHQVCRVRRRGRVSTKAASHDGRRRVPLRRLPDVGARALLRRSAQPARRADQPAGRHVDGARPTKLLWAALFSVLLLGRGLPCWTGARSSRSSWASCSSSFPRRPTARRARPRRRRRRGGPHARRLQRAGGAASVVGVLAACAAAALSASRASSSSTCSRSPGARSSSATSSSASRSPALPSAARSTSRRRCI